MSYFEFGTLAAMQIFSDVKLDVAIYEVGLGGRLDAVNILDADLAIISNIGIDHVQWLGLTRESIGLEKAGMYYYILANKVTALEYVNVTLFARIYNI